MKSCRASRGLSNQGAVRYETEPVRARVAHLALRYGSPALDVGTGACACMAVSMARLGLRVDAVDYSSSAVRIAQERATGKLADSLEVHYADGARLPFPDGFYRVVTAFDALCHAPNPTSVLVEMFRVCTHGGVVIIVELNADGRLITRHRDVGFEESLPGLLGRHCRTCRQLDYPHHAVYVCEKP